MSGDVHDPKAIISEVERAIALAQVTANETTSRHLKTAEGALTRLRDSLDGKVRLAPGRARIGNREFDIEAEPGQTADEWVEMVEQYGHTVVRRPSLGGPS